MTIKPSSLKLIKFTPKYTNQVKSLVFKVMRELRPDEDPTKEPRHKDLDKIENIYKNRGRFWIFIDKDRVVGSVAVLEKSFKKAMLKSLFLEKSYRGKKTGKYLLQHAIKFCMKKGYQELELITSHHTSVAIKLFEKFGFFDLARRAFFMD